MNQLCFRTIAILAFMCCTSAPINAQVSSFELADYKLADVRIQSFTNQFQLYQNGEVEKGIPDNTIEKRRNNVNLNYKGSYNLYKNTRPYQRNTTFSAFFDGYRNTNQFGNEDARNLQYSTHYNWNSGLEISDIHRKYFTPKVFIEAQFLGRYNFYQLYDFDQSISPTTEVFGRTGIDEHTLSVGVPVKLGMGRLERVEDARQAIFLMQELQKVGRMRDSISQSEYLNLSTLVSQLRNRRFFDVRLQRIYQIKAIDTFLQQNNLTNQLDAEYFTTAFDYWMFGGGPARMSGNRFAIAFYPMSTRQIKRDARVGTDVILESNFKNQFYQGFLALECDLEKAINQKWQSSFTSRLYFGNRSNSLLTEYIFSETENRYDLSSIQFQLNYGIGFYPTTRTAITWSAGLDLARVQKRNKDVSIQPVGNYDFDLDRNLFYTR